MSQNRIDSNNAGAHREHYDYEMSQVFFDELEISAPDEYSTADRHTRRADRRGDAAFEPVLLNTSGLGLRGRDVNSTLACALVCASWAYAWRMWRRSALWDGGCQRNSTLLTDRWRTVFTPHRKRRQPEA